MSEQERLILKKMMEAADAISKIDTAIDVMMGGITTDSDSARRGIAHSVGLLNDMRGDTVRLLVASAEVLVGEVDDG